MPSQISGSPMTYQVDGRQYIVVGVSGGGVTGEYQLRAAAADDSTDDGGTTVARDVARDFSPAMVDLRKGGTLGPALCFSSATGAARPRAGRPASEVQKPNVASAARVSSAITPAPAYTLRQVCRHRKHDEQPRRVERPPPPPEARRATGAARRVRSRMRERRAQSRSIRRRARRRWNRGPRSR